MFASSGRSPSLEWATLDPSTSTTGPDSAPPDRSAVLLGRPSLPVVILAPCTGRTPATAVAGEQPAVRAALIQVPHPRADVPGARTCSKHTLCAPRHAVSVTGSIRPIMV